MHYRETKYGFEYGSAAIERCCSDRKKGWVVLRVTTPRHPLARSIDIYCTKSGKVRVHSGRTEWKPAAIKTKTKKR